MHIIWIVLALCVSGYKMHPFDKEPMCTSKFDFEEKLLEKVIRMEVTIETANKKAESELAKFGKDIATFSLEFENMRTVMSQTVKDLKDNFQELQAKADMKLIEIEGNVGAAVDGMKDNFQELQDNANVKLAEMEETVGTAVDGMKQRIESTIKPGVIFHVQDINGQPTANSVIKFTTVVQNTDDVYNLDTGCFTTPVNGTYWFSAQICTPRKHVVYPSLYIQDTLVIRKYIKNSDDHSCGAFSTVAVVQATDVVCLKAGPSMNTNPVWSSSSNNMNNFMGVLIH